MSQDTKQKSSANTKGARPSSYRQKLKEAMREQILLSAEAVFADKGFANAKVEEIASRAEVAVGTIYLHFGNKEELYYSLLDSRITLVDSCVKKAAEDAHTPIEAIKKIVEAQLLFFETNILFFKIFLHETLGFEWNIQFKFGDEFMERYRDHVRFIAGVFEQGIAQGEFTEDYTSMDLAIALQGMINAFTTAWSQDKPPGNFMENAEIILNLFFGSILQAAPCQGIEQRKERKD